MSYYELFDLKKEPFSSSPDPDFFYESEGHREVVVKLMIEIFLKRGLSVVLGDIGLGKTTLSRKLIQSMAERLDVIPHLVLDPTCESEDLFLSSLCQTFGIHFPSYEQVSLLDKKEALKKYLYQKAVTENKIVVLVIDEAQKLNETALEALRVLLNYETNEFKLLQLVLLGQLELLPKIKGMQNFWQRINWMGKIEPLTVEQTRQMIAFRLKVAGYTSRLPLFDDAACYEIHKVTKGYPRRIALYAHNLLRMMIASDQRGTIRGSMVADFHRREVQTTLSRY